MIRVDVRSREVVVNTTSDPVGKVDVVSRAPAVRQDGQGPTGPRGPAGYGLPAGGDARQVLAKLSAADYDSGWITLVAADVGLGNVADLAPADMPLSTAQQAAITGEAEARATADAQKVAKTGDVMTGVLTLPAGSNVAPSVNFAGALTTGMYFGGGVNGPAFATAGALVGYFNGSNQFTVPAGFWSSGPAGLIKFGPAGDVGLSRSAPGLLLLGNGTSGDQSGTLKAAGVVVNGTGPGPAGYAISVPSPGAAFGSNFNYLNLNSNWGAANFNIWGGALGIMGGGFSALTLAGSIYVDKNRVIGISSGTAFGVGPDVAFSRLGAATFALGNGTAGNTSGSLSLKNLVASGGITAGAWTVATKPSPAAYPAGTLIYIADESGGPTLAWTDGAAWRRIRDNVIIS